MSNVVFAITIGSQRVTAAAIKYAGRTRSEIFIEQENSNDAVSHGRVIDPKTMSGIISKLILKLNNRAKIKGMREAYIAIGGITMHSFKHMSSKPELPDMWIINSEQNDKDDYLHTTIDLKAFTAVEDALNLAKVKAIDMITIPKATSTILSAEEKLSGCFLVDIGYGTTTIQIFSEGHLQHLAVIPIGGEAVTRDIMTLANISHDQAESLKTGFSDASINIDNVDEKKEKSFEDAQLPIDRQLLNNIVVCRYEEIFKNVLQQIRISGINGFTIGVLTGGGSKQTGIETLTRRVLGMPALAVQRRAFSEPSDILSGKSYELTDIYGLASLCPVPDPVVTVGTQTTVEPTEHSKTVETTGRTEPTAVPNPTNQDKDKDKHDNKEQVKEQESKGSSFGSWVKGLFTSNNPDNTKN